MALGGLSLLAFVVMFFWLPDPPKNKTATSTVAPPLREVLSCRSVLGGDPRATRIDLIEWKQPKTAGIPYPHLYHAGAARIALFTKNIDDEYARLQGLGVERVSEPVVIQFPNKGGAKFFCLKDPDGTFLKLIEPFQNTYFMERIIPPSQGHYFP